MKQLLFVFALVVVASLSVNAQACTKAAGKSCCMAKKTASVDAGTSSNTQVASASLEADLAASATTNITKRTCESGTTAYYEKSVCAVSGKISYDEVKYDATTKSFTKVASASMEKNEDGTKVAPKACCKKDGAKACAGQKASVN